MPATNGGSPTKRSFTLLGMLITSSYQPAIC